MKQIEVRNAMKAAANGDQDAAYMLSELAGSWRDRRQAKKAERQTKRATRKSERQARQEGLRRKTYRQEPRTFGSFGTAGSMAGFHEKNLAKDVARDAAFNMAPAVQTRGAEDPDDIAFDVTGPTVDIFPAVEPTAVIPEEKTFMQKNWPYIAGGAAVLLIGGILLTRKKK